MKKEQIIKLGGKLWEKENKKRVYITCDILNKLDKINGGRGDYSLNDSKNSIWYDVKTNKVNRQYCGRRITTEIDFNDIKNKSIVDFIVKKRKQPNFKNNTLIDLLDMVNDLFDTSFEKNDSEKYLTETFGKDGMLILIGV